MGRKGPAALKNGCCEKTEMELELPDQERYGKQPGLLGMSYK